MAGTILAAGLAGQTAYAVVSDNAGKLWTGATFEVYTEAHWTSYAVALTQQGTSGRGTASVPIATFAGLGGTAPYDVDVRIQSGASAAPTDAASTGGVLFDNLAALPLALPNTAGGLHAPVLASGTAQAGTSSSITLAAGDAGTAAAYVGAVVQILGGTGIGEYRTIAAYNAGTKVATLATGRTFGVAPDATSVYAIIANAHPALNDSLQVVSSSVAGAVGSVTAGVTVTTNSDKTGYALTVGEHTSIATDAQTGLTAQGYTTTRAAFLDTLNGLVAAVWNALTSGMATVGSIGILLKTFSFTGANVNANAQVVADKTGYSLAVAPPTAAAISSAVAAAILVTPANLLTTNASGQVQSDMTQLLPTPRDISAVLDAALNVGDARWSAIGAGAGRKAEATTTSYVIKTPGSGTTIRTYVVSPALTGTLTSVT